MLHPGNRKVLAYVREHDDDVILCVANVSRIAQAVELELQAWKGRVPVEMMGRNPFPPIGDLPYLLTLPGHEFFWFRLALDAEPPRWHTERLALDLHVAPQHLTLHPSNEVSFMTTALSMVSAGLGVTACLPYAVSLVRLHQLQIRPLHEPELRRKFQVYRRAQVSLSPAAEQFMAFLLRYVAAHGWGEAAP